MRWLSTLGNHWSAVRRNAALVGFRASLSVQFLDIYNRRLRFGLPAHWPVLRVMVPGFRFPAYLRTGTTDLQVLRQILSDREYAPLDAVPANVVVDCGAYAGYSSLYFLNRHPTAHVLAIEPDPDNVGLCQRNLQPYGPRARVIQAALWSHPCTMTVVPGEYRDGQAWATYVRPATTAGTIEVRAIDMPSVLQMVNADSIDLLKMDIERSELAVFSKEPRLWMAHVKNLVIELHDQGCQDAFFEALQSFDCEIVRSADITICRDIRPKQLAHA